MNLYKKIIVNNWISNSKSHKHEIHIYEEALNEVRYPCGLK